MATLDRGGFDLAYSARGEGPATVLVHGMAASSADWDVEGLGGRVIAYDRRCYGASSAPEPYTRTTVSEQAEDLAALVAELGAAPALLVGDGFGALVVLDVLLRHTSAARAAVLIDPPLHAFTPEATEALSAERQALEEWLREGGPREAVARWLGPGADPARVERARADARAFFADYGARSTLPLTRADLRGLSVPVGVVASGEGPAAAAAPGDERRGARPAAGAAEALLRLAPHARAFGDWREAVEALA